MKKEIKVEWTGSYPCLCSGRWVITIDGNDVSDCIPVDLQGSPMNTENDYRQWHFEDWEVVWETVHQGLPFDAWLAKNQWVKSLPINSSQYEELYDAISYCDWIHGSCGGCI